MQRPDLHKALSVFSSQNGSSRPGGAHSGAGLDPDPLQWCCPMDMSTEASAPRAEEHNSVHVLDKISIDHLLTTSHGTDSNRSNVTEDAFLLNLLEPSFLTPEADSPQSCHFPHIVVCPLNRTDTDKSMQNPFQAPADSAQDSLWGLAWEAMESRMCSAEDSPQQLYDLSPTCSMDLSGHISHVSTAWEGNTTKDQACSAQCEGSTGSEESCSYPPATFAFPAADFLPEPAAWASRANARPAAAKRAASNARPTSAQPPAAAAQPLPAAAAQLQAAELAVKLRQAAARPKTASAAIPPRPAAARASPGKRRRQRDYMKRRRVRPPLRIFKALSNQWFLLYDPFFGQS